VSTLKSLLVCQYNPPLCIINLRSIWSFFWSPHRNVLYLRINLLAFALYQHPLWSYLTTYTFIH
jgi:hypothetical protein